MPAQTKAMDANAEPNIGAKRRKRILIGCVIIFLIWAIPAYIAQWSKLAQKSAELASMQQQLDEQKQKNEQTKREIVRLNDPEYIEQKIRSELHWYKPGETVFPAQKVNP